MKGDSIRVAYHKSYEGGTIHGYIEYNPSDTLEEIDTPEQSIEIVTLRRTRLDDLTKEGKDYLKSLMECSVENYWNEEHLIPAGTALKRIRQDILDSIVYMDHIYIKDDEEISRFMNDRIGPTINKELRKENRKLRRRQSR